MYEYAYDAFLCRVFIKLGNIQLLHPACAMNFCLWKRVFFLLLLSLCSPPFQICSRMLGDTPEPVAQGVHSKGILPINCSTSRFNIMDFNFFNTY